MRKLTMKKFIAACAVATLASLSAAADTVTNHVAGIFDIYPITESTTANTALKSGQKFQFMVRLVSPNYDDATPVAWAPYFVGAGSEELAKLRPPQIGIVVSGQLRYADIKSWSANSDKGAAYTDLICEYAVEPGDFALPVKLALSSSTTLNPKIPYVDDTGLDSKYYVANVRDHDPLSALWEFQAHVTEGENTTIYVCDFKYCSTEEVWANAKAAPGWPSSKQPVLDIDLTKASFYVKSIDFDDNVDAEEEGYWRVVHEGTTSTTYHPTIETIGTADTNSAPTTSVKLYVWAEDESVVKMTGSGVTEKTLHLPPDGQTTDTRQVYEFDLVTGVTSYPIQFRGVTRGKTTKLILSATPDYQYLQDDKTLVTNYLSRVVACDEPPAPSVTFSFDGEGGNIEDVTAATNATRDISSKAAVPVYVTLSEAFGESVTINIKAQITGDDTTDVFEKKYIGVNTKNDQFTVPPQETNLTFTSTEKIKTFYVYPVGGNDATVDKGIRFTPVFAEGTSDAIKEKYDVNACTLTIRDASPAIVSPDVTTLLTGSVKEGCAISVEVVDCYRDLNEPQAYTVEVTFSDGGSFTMNDVAFRSGKPTTITATGFGSKATWARIKVTDPQGNQAVSANIPMTVPAAKTVSAELVATQSESETAIDNLAFAEGQTRYLRFRLGPDSTATSLTDMYAFLVPLNVASSNLVKTAATTEGVLIPADKEVSKVMSTAALTFLDGCAAAENLQFDIVLRSGEKLTDPEITTYQPQKLYISVTNVAPSIASVRVNAEPVSNGGTSSKKPAEANVKLSATISDASWLDLTNATDRIIVKWTISDGPDDTKSFAEYYTTNEVGSATVEYTHQFNTPGTTQTVKIQAQDKDMRALDAWGDVYEFSVQVVDSPFVQILDSYGRNMATDTASVREDTKNAYITVQLSDAPAGVTAKKPLVVLLTCEAQGDGGCTLATNRVEFTATLTKKNIYLKDLDGAYDSTFYFTATVQNEETNSYGQRWCDYYGTGEGLLIVENADPGISGIKGASTSITNNVPLNTPRELSVTVSDIAIDLNKPDFQVKWLDPTGSEHISSGDEITYNTRGSGSTFTTNSITAKWTFTPTTEEYFAVTVTVEDGDGGADSQQIWFYVQPTKRIIVGAYGPGSASSMQSKYGSAKGRGKGRIYADADRYTISGFRHTYYTAVDTSAIEVYAYGYAAAADAKGYLDDGSIVDELGDKRDRAISTGGRNDGTTISAYYRYGKTAPSIEDEWMYDNFFYCWYDASDELCIAEAANGAIKAATSPIAETWISANLDPYEDNKKSYAVRNLEAIFSREWRTDDNMGDINADGIPDIYVKQYKFDIVDDSGKTTGDDLNELDSYNEDADYLPNTGTSKYSAFIPGLSSTWVTTGRPFTAIDEIRGWEQGGASLAFNDAPTQLGLASGTPDVRYTDPATDSKSTLSALEWWAFQQYCEKIGRDVTDTTLWGAGASDKTYRWSPERPTNPMLEDTDKDGFPDGYEYYVWYRSHVGYQDADGTFKKLTGRRYNPYDPAHPIIIPAEVLERIYDPQVKASAAEDTDTDNDGITDLVEFEMGTNPFDFDTDGDGLPDGYEALYSEEDDSMFDPLKYSSNGSESDAEANPDKDAMAWQEVEMPMIGFVAARTNVYTVGGETIPQTNIVAVTNMFVGDGSWVLLADGITEGAAEDEAPTLENLRLGYYVNCADGTKYVTDQPGEYGEEEGKCLLSAELTGYNVADCTSTNIGDVACILLGSASAETIAEGTRLNNYAPFDFTVGSFYESWDYDESTRAVGRIYGLEDISNLLGRKVDVVGISTNVFMHYQVYQHCGFNPFTAVDALPVEHTNTVVNTKKFTNYDEYMLMTFLAREGLIAESDLVATKDEPWSTLWSKYTTSPVNADSDEDGTPDGWELYTIYAMGESPRGWELETAGSIGSLETWYPDQNNGGDSDGLTFAEEFSGIRSVACYPDCSTITLRKPEWRNKAWPTDPWNSDTDGDGINDATEGTMFLYGDAGTAGGGLNPLSWDTDGDGLPDPWEVEFAGTWTVGGTTTITNIVQVSATGVTNIISSNITWNDDGMDGTVDDAMKDYDHDGLANWQEYMVGAMRCWRYDDPISHWGMHSFDPGMDIPAPGTEEWNEFWYQRLVDDQNNGNSSNKGRNGYQETEYYNPRLCSGTFDAGVYFSRCTNTWDSAYGKYYMFYDGIYHDLTEKKYKIGEEMYNRFEYKVNKPDKSWGLMVPTFAVKNLCPLKYICCDPRLPDTDYDGMDDYYELFHGLNPLLGKEQAFIKSTPTARDLIYEAYDKVWSADENYWLNEEVCQRVKPSMRYPSGKLNSDMDFEAYPWMAGLAEADPDGDNIRNYIEAILPNVQANASYLHTDPSPLWMTDTTYSKSLTRRYYLIDGPGSTSFDAEGSETFEYGEGAEHRVYKFTDFPGFSYSDGTLSYSFSSLNVWNVVDYMYDFEENEGYDSDHDYLSDFEEAQGRTKSASDPQSHDSPMRRQAMWFGGADDPSFLQSPLPIAEVVAMPAAASEARENYLYYTVECWAKPDASILDTDKSYTLVERDIWTDSSNLGDEKYLRRNFYLGVKNGRWYTMFDSTGTDKGQAVEITDGPVASTNWTYVAATYDGSALKLYVNGVCKNTKATQLQPQHDTQTLKVNVQGEIDPNGGTKYYDMLTYLVGASAANWYGFQFDYSTEFYTTSFVDYNSYYKGYIDEVRIWDGARSAADILNDYKNRTRYTLELAAENRQAVFEKWTAGSRRAGVIADLPVELKHHWAFDHLPGAVETADVLKTPAGFSTDSDVDDAKATWSRPVGWKNTWWGSSEVRSKVYTDTSWIPWINNTVSHLPRFDQTTLDSIYWSANFAGAGTATSYGYSSFGFPRTAEVYSRWTQMQYGYDNGPYTTPSRWELIEGDEALEQAYRFAHRDRHVIGDDLLPMGGAYPRRISTAEGGMWDDEGAADAWAQVGEDEDNNGLPDWWEELARDIYSLGSDPTSPITWNSTVDYEGMRIPAWEAYRRDIARGMLPDCEYHDEYADTRDVDGDGMPDWWEDLYGIDTGSQADAFADPDHDGLSNYQEYLISEVDCVKSISPVMLCSGANQTETDYFLRLDSGKYLGEVYADHDFMEDDNEDEINTDRTLYDAYSDLDEDGWTAWSEMRYSTFKSGIAARFISHLVGETEVRDFPIPVIHATLRYHGEAGTNTNAVVVVEAYSGSNLQKQPTATYRVVPGQAQSRSVYLGAWEDRVVHGTLTPGHVVAGMNKIALQYAFVQPNDLFAWRVGSDESLYSGTYADMREAVATYGTNVVVSAKEFEWQDSMELSADRTSLQVSVDDQTQKGYLLLSNERAGEIDFVTGDFTFDLGKLKNWCEADTYILYQQCFFRLTYESIVPTMQANKLPISLATADEGKLVEGEMSFVAYMDMAGDGSFTPGVDPIGFVKNVSVGWDQVPELVIEMADSSQAAGSRFAYDAGAPIVRIVRTEINGTEKNVKRRIVYSRNAADMARKTVYEADLVTDSKFGIDWSSLRSDILAMDGMNLRDVTSVGYVVVTNEGSILNIDSSEILNSFTVEYAAEISRPTCQTPSTNAYGIVETTRPTFTWTGPDGYTAFRLQIGNAEGEWIYTNELTVLPPRDSSSRYTWTAPVYIGTNVCNDAWALNNGTTYKWRVAMYNAKFSDTADETYWSDAAEFRTALATDNSFKTSYGSVQVNIGYFGPATNDLDSVVVQLFRSADFRGAPAAQTRLHNIDGAVSSLTNLQTVVFNGLEDGDYYAVAFIDRNGNCTREKYETWGYAAQVGLNVQAIWTPLAATADATIAKIPSVDLFMEDTDINQSDVLDIFEDESIFVTATTSSSGADTSDVDGDGLTGDEEVSDTYTNSQKWDTDGDGLPDGWEARFADTDPLLSDADTCADGDVMAYVEVSRTLVTDRVGNYYLLNPTNKEVRVGDTLKPTQLMTTYTYGSKYGLGTNLVTGADFLVDKIESVKVALVHAQVYDAYGFNQKTAVINDEAVHTKAFTALDKYLLVKYFAAIGIKDANEESMNKNKAWSDFTLKPGDTDNDRDGVADGWELYVMFGPNGVASAQKYKKPAETLINPWSFDDRAKDTDGDELELVGEYNRGKAPMNPWNQHTLNDEINDKEASEFNIASGDTQLADDDNDGLSNWAEYLATKAGYGYGSNFQVDDDYSVSRQKDADYVIDYFRPITDGDYTGWYVGEARDEVGTHLIADHDFIEDWWEDQYDVNFANRYVYDFYADRDGDGWSNWSEARADTDPTRTATLGIENLPIAEYPVPLIKLVVNSSDERVQESAIIVQAWKDSLLEGVPDAIWRVGSSDEGDSVSTTNASFIYLGTWQDKVRKGYLSPGSVSPSSVRLQAREASTDWTYLLSDVASKADPSKGVFKLRSDAYQVSDENMRTADLGTINYLTGEVQIYFTLLKGEATLRVPYLYNEDGSVLDWTYTTVNLEDAYYKVTYDTAVPGKTLPATFYLKDAEVASSESKGHLREGLNSFLVFADIDGDGAFTPGEPFGFKRNVSVGWDKVPELEISLSPRGTAIPRMNLADGSVTADNNWAEGTNTVYDSAQDSQRVRIVRTSVNGQTEYRGKSLNGVVFNRVMDFTQRTTLTEAEIIRGSRYDLDWGKLTNVVAAANLSLADVQTVEYRVVLGDGSVRPPVESNNVALTFTKTFDSVRFAPTAVSPSTNSYYKLLSAQPTFRWTGSSSYTAFKIEVFKASDTNTVIWTSGLRAMPALMPEGYSYTAPLYVGETNVEGRVVLEDNTAYCWHVAQYNAKFCSDKAISDGDAVWSEMADFMTAIDSERANSGYGKVNADIRYYGPAQASMKQVTVEAYATADFTGNPVARVRLGGADDLSSLKKYTTSAEDFMINQPNAELDGLAPGEYYMLAYIDINQNGVRDAYEPWGYACQVGKVTASEDGQYRIWEPETIKVKSVKEGITSAIVFMEDTDVNQNMTPDCLEDMSGWEASTGTEESEDDTGDGSSGGTTSRTDADGDGLTTSDEEEAATDSSNWDTDGDGMPDGWEYKFAGTDPNEPDAGTCSDGDVMAFAVVKRTVIKVTSTATGDSTYYIVPEGMTVPKGGENVNGMTFETAYPYSASRTFSLPLSSGDYLGLGQPVTIPSTETYKLATVTTYTNNVDGDVTTPYVIGTATVLFKSDASIAEGTNVNNFVDSIWTIAGTTTTGEYLRGVVTNFPASVGYEAASNVVTTAAMDVEVSLGENRVDGLESIYEDVPVALVHAQVYDKFGYDSKTAVVVDDAVNTKAFTALDKYLVSRYLAANGLGDESMMNRGRTWSSYTLKPGDTDNDRDGVADGWELYVMFGPDGVQSAANYALPSETPINPWTYDDARTAAPDKGGLKVIEEYDRGNYPTNPWDMDTDKDGVGDYYAYIYHLKGGHSGDDNDGDGLSNYAEYLISEVFGFAKLDPDNPKTDGSCVDYFRKITGVYDDNALYFGEIFTDHDQVDDLWEAKYSQSASREIYDPNRDDDGDGWSNWAESMAGTNPGAKESTVTGEVLPAYPIPTVEATVHWAGNAPITNAIVFKAWNEETDADMVKAPDAVWTIGSDTSTSNAVKNIGVNPKTMVTYYLSAAGLLVPGSVNIEFNDIGYNRVSISTNNTMNIQTYEGESSEVQWHSFAHDRNGVMYFSATGYEEVKVGTVDYDTGLVTVDFGNDALNSTVRALVETADGYDNYDELALSRSRVRFTWEAKEPSALGRGYATYHLASADAETSGLGYLREGTYKFIAFADSDGDGEYTPGDPFGFVYGVDVGWSGAKFEVELTETHPVFGRVNLVTGEDDRTVRYGLESGNWTNLVGGTLSGGTKERVRVVRTLVNGYVTGGSETDTDRLPVDNRVVMDKWFDLSVRAYLHEGDFIDENMHDLDWSTFESEVRDSIKSRNIDPQQVTYRIVLGDGSVDARGTNNLFKTAFNRVFDSAKVNDSGEDNRVVASKLYCTAQDGVVYGSHPTFRWTMGKYNSYTAFKLQIMDASGAIIYDSGYRRAPRVDADEYYTYTIPESIGDQMNVKNKYGILNANGNFTARVSMYNAKFKTTDAWSNIAHFSTAVNAQQDMNDHGYSTIAVSVKYAGPSDVLAKCGTTSQPNGIIRLQAFTTPDFSGTPVSQAIVVNKDDASKTQGIVADTANNLPNAWVIGLPATGTYYLRAYIDSNGNFEKDDWESWGSVGPVTLSTSDVVAPVVGLYIEDADTDGDWLPDAWEYAANGWTGTWDSVKNKKTANVKGEGKILFSGTTFVNATNNLAGISTGLEGASLTIFQSGDIASMLGFSGASSWQSIADIRAAVQEQMRVQSQTLKITSISLDQNGKRVILTIDADVALSVAGELVANIYNITGLATTKEVVVKVYKKNTLVEADWTFVTEETVSIGQGDQTVEATLDDVDFKSGFYKVEVVEE
jgi:hypothetical protein